MGRSLRAAGAERANYAPADPQKEQTAMKRFDWIAFTHAIALIALVAEPAGAVPAQIPYVGEVQTETGELYEGSVIVEVGVFDSEADGKPLWTEEIGEIEIVGGVLRFALGLKDPEGLGEALSAGVPLYLELVLDATPMAPRQQMLSVPFARVAGDALRVDGLSANELVVQDPGGNVVVAGQLQVAGSLAAASVSSPLVTTSLPVAGNQAATKDYVDTIVANAAGQPGAAGATCYYTTMAVCGDDYELQPGQYVNSGQSHNICCTRRGESTAGRGFFVLTQTEWQGNLGGLAGANQRCLTELQATQWLGKNRATLTAANVQAFLCDSSTCQDPRPNTTYRFATAGSLSTGGAAIATDYYGRGPQNTAAWSTGEYLSSGSYIWMGQRTVVSSSLWGVMQPQTSGASFSCANWTVSAGQTGTIGYPLSGNGQRWNYLPDNCNFSNPLLCMVHPVEP
jgi:hypothetical protein